MRFTIKTLYFLLLSAGHWVRLGYYRQQSRLCRQVAQLTMVLDNKNELAAHHAGYAVKRIQAVVEKTAISPPMWPCYAAPKPCDFVSSNSWIHYGLVRNACAALRAAQRLRHLYRTRPGPATWTGTIRLNHYGRDTTFRVTVPYRVARR